MGRAGVSAAGFALVGGSAADPAGVVYIAPVPDRFGRILLVGVEPLDPSPRGMELAAVALRAIRETFAAAPGSCADALVAAFASANAAVMAENRPLSTGRWERRICIGATGVALAGREMTVAQSAPSQAMVVQDGQVYAFPDIASWRGDFVPDAPLVETHPLGFAEETAPRLYASEAAPGDLIVLCATSVGRTLARDEEAIVDLDDGSLLTGDLEGSVDRLERLLARHDVVDAYAVVTSVARLPRRSRLGAAIPHGRRSDGPISRDIVNGARSRAGETDTHAAHVPAIDTPYSVPCLDERPPLFEGIRDWAIQLAELVSAGRQGQAPVSAGRQTTLAAPGALSVRRYRDATALPPAWRANLPRGPGVQVPVRLLAVSLMLFVALGGTSIAAVRQRDREARVESSLIAADTALRSALEHPGTAMSSVALAEGAVATARAAGATGDSLARREEELARIRDDVWGILRLGDVVLVGALPHELGSGPVRLAISGQTLYLAAENLYELDPGEERLIALLSRGDSVAGGSAGDIRHVSIDNGNVVASDGTASYVRDKAGRWQRQPLAIDDVGGLRADAPVIDWGDAAYGLSWDGDIVRFDRSAAGPLAAIWAAADDVPDLETARDLAIDGRIHALLADGRMLTLSHGTLTGTIAPFVAPALNAPSFLAAAPFANAFYIVDRNGTIGENAGRIVRVDAAGNAVQYLTPAPVARDLAGNVAAVSLATAEDLAIDELTGTVYWVSQGEIWRASLPVG